MISREDFLSLRPTGFPKHEDVEIPDLGTIKIKMMNAGERDHFEQQHTKYESRNFRARLVAHTAITEQGAMMFDESDVDQLALFDPRILDPLVRAAIRINKFSEEDQADLKKNLNGHLDGSSSALPAISENHSAK